jgi:hypothetical protein
MKMGEKPFRLKSQDLTIRRRSRKNGHNTFVEVSGWGEVSEKK